MRAIFISYRREDVEGHARSLFQDLIAEFGKDKVFMDVEGIEPGLDFRENGISSPSLMPSCNG